MFGATGILAIFYKFIFSDYPGSDEKVLAQTE